MLCDATGLYCVRECGDYCYRTGTFFCVSFCELLHFLVFTTLFRVVLSFTTFSQLKLTIPRSKKHLCKKWSFWHFLLLFEQCDIHAAFSANSCLFVDLYACLCAKTHYQQVCIHLLHFVVCKNSENQGQKHKKLILLRFL